MALKNDLQVTVRPITVRYDSVCSRCGREVVRGEEAMWYSHHDKVEESRPKRRIVCRSCEPLKPRRAGVKNKEIRPGSGTSFRGFREYLQAHELREKTA